MVDTYPDFKIDAKKVAAAITPLTKMILLNSPANPTGAVASAEEVRALAELAAKHNIVLISDEIYREFCYDAPFASPTARNDQTIVIDGFSKTYGVTGWRLGFVHGPSAIIDKMTMLQQYTFVCAPHPLQWAALAALDVDMSQACGGLQASPRLGCRRAGESRLRSCETGRSILRLSTKSPSGARRSEFVANAPIANELLVIPGERVQRSRHSFPHLLCGKRGDDRTRLGSLSQSERSITDRRLSRTSKICRRLANHTDRVRCRPLRTRNSAASI